MGSLNSDAIASSSPAASANSGTSAKDAIMKRVGSRCDLRSQAALRWQLADLSLVFRPCVTVYTGRLRCARPGRSLPCLACASSSPVRSIKMCISFNTPPALRIVSAPLWPSASSRSLVEYCKSPLDSCCSRPCRLRLVAVGHVCGVRVFLCNTCSNIRTLLGKVFLSKKRCQIPS